MGLPSLALPQVRHFPLLHREAPERLARALGTLSPGPHRPSLPLAGPRPKALGYVTEWFPIACSGPGAAATGRSMERPARCLACSQPSACASLSEEARAFAPSPHRWGQPPGPGPKDRTAAHPPLCLCTQTLS